MTTKADKAAMENVEAPTDVEREAMEVVGDGEAAESRGSRAGFVEYTGTHHTFFHRQMTPKDWKSGFGVESGAKQVEWASTNKFRVPASDLEFLNEEQLQQLLDSGEFKLVQE